MNLGTMHERRIYMLDCARKIELSEQSRKIEGWNELYNGIHDLNTIISMLPDCEFGEDGRKLRPARRKTRA